MLKTSHRAGQCTIGAQACDRHRVVVFGFGFVVFKFPTAGNLWLPDKRRQNLSRKRANPCLRMCLVVYFPLLATPPPLEWYSQSKSWYWVSRDRKGCAMITLQGTSAQPFISSSAENRLKFCPGVCLLNTQLMLVPRHTLQTHQAHTQCQDKDAPVSSLPLKEKCHLYSSNTNASSSSSIAKYTPILQPDNMSRIHFT